jgi:hypothetical protein
MAMVNVLIILLVVGVIWRLWPRSLSWFGRLPGDIRLEREGLRLYIPLTSMLLASVLFSVALSSLGWLMRLLMVPVRWFGRLPGDIRIVGDSVTVFIPITSLLLLSVVVNLVLWFVRRGKGRG